MLIQTLSVECKENVCLNDVAFTSITKNFGDLGKLRGDEAELVVAEELPESQSLKGAVHQLLNALQRCLLIDLGLICGITAVNCICSLSPSQKKKKN